MAAGAVVWGGHGFAVQDARQLASKGFRPPFGLGRVTLERPALIKKCTKGLLPVYSPDFAGFLRLTRLSDGTRRRAFGLRHPWLRPKPASNIPVLAPNRVELRSPFSDLAHGPAPLARHPVSRPGQAGSPQRIRGRSNAPVFAFMIDIIIRTYIVEPRYAVVKMKLVKCFLYKIPNRPHLEVLNQKKMHAFFYKLSQGLQKKFSPSEN